MHPIAHLFLLIKLPLFSYKKWPISTSFCLHLTAKKSCFLWFHCTALCLSKSIFLSLFCILFSCFSSSLLKTCLHASMSLSLPLLLCGLGGLVAWTFVSWDVWWLKFATLGGYDFWCKDIMWGAFCATKVCFREVWWKSCLYVPYMFPVFSIYLFLNVPPAFCISKSLCLYFTLISPPRFPVTGLVVCCTQFRCAKSKRATQQKRKIAISQKCRFKTVIFPAVINISAHRDSTSDEALFKILYLHSAAGLRHGLWNKRQTEQFLDLISESEEGKIQPSQKKYKKIRNEKWEKETIIWEPANANERETKQTWDRQFRDWETGRKDWDNIRELDWETKVV